jgi:hypothetical protein
MGLPANRFRGTQGHPPPRIPAQHTRMELHYLRRSLQHQYTPQRYRNQQIRRLRHLVPASRLRRRTDRPLASRNSSCVAV